MDLISTENLTKEFFSKDASVHLAILFGSYGSGRQTLKSDVDVAIDTGVPFTLEYRQQIQSELTEVLGKKVDLIDLRSVHGTILMEALQGKVLKNRFPSEFAKLIKSALIDKQDFGRMREKILKIRRELYFGSSI